METYGCLVGFATAVTLRGKNREVVRRKNNQLRFTFRDILRQTLCRE